MFDDVDFGNNITAFESRVATTMENGKIEIRLDNLSGTIIGKCKVSATHSVRTYVTASCDISKVVGFHKVFLMFSGKINMSWFRLINK